MSADQSMVQVSRAVTWMYGGQPLGMTEGWDEVAIYLSVGDRTFTGASLVVIERKWRLKQSGYPELMIVLGDHGEGA
jgi:hypothetical protein